MHLCLLLRYYLSIRNCFHWWSLTAFATKIIHTVIHLCHTLGSVLAITCVLNKISCKNSLYSGAAVSNIVLHTVCCCVWISFDALLNIMLFCMQLYLLKCCIHCYSISGCDHCVFDVGVDRLAVLFPGQAWVGYVTCQGCVVYWLLVQWTVFKKLTIWFSKFGWQFLVLSYSYKFD